MSPREGKVILGWALAAVLVSSAVLIALIFWLVWLLGVSDWCGRALGAAKYVTGRPDYAINDCFELLKMQIKALAEPLLIAVLALAGCLGVLVVIVLANGRLSFKTPGGVEGNVSRDVGSAAQTVAAAAQDKADDITDAAS